MSTLFSTTSTASTISLSTRASGSMQNRILSRDDIRQRLPKDEMRLLSQMQMLLSTRRADQCANHHRPRGMLHQCVQMSISNSTSANIRGDSILIMSKTLLGLGLGLGLTQYSEFVFKPNILIDVAASCILKLFFLEIHIFFASRYEILFQSITFFLHETHASIIEVDFISRN